MENSNPSMEKNPAESSTSAPSKKTSLAHTLRLRFEDELSSDEAESSTRSNTNGRESTTSDHDYHQSNQEVQTIINQMIELVVYEENSSSDTRSIASQETQSYTSNHQQSYGFTENGVDLNGYNFPYHTPSYQHND
ncbi:hypothetical protein L484_002514 [Morus notabilis]|uniref:Uncharacterized protein n=1 Tax=Morus notabilis TaxID=981085 RepID=W9QPU3_9ROSA|nr:hypothetical protein L484_002514 [Morus notabilis]